jgi:hypothetical protein
MAGVWSSSLGLLGLVGSLLACADSADRGGSPEGLDGAAAGDALTQSDAPTTAAVLCSDGQIAAAIRSVSEGEVSLVQAVRENFADRTAAALADHMLTEHSLLLFQLNGETRAAQIAPVDCALARALTSSAGADTASLQTLRAPAVDRAYVEREVLAHLQSLALLDGFFAPGARNERIVYAIRVMRDVETQHLGVALAAQRTIEGACTAEN